MSVALGALVSGFTTTSGACVGLATSHAETDIVYSGTYSEQTNNMKATSLANGEVVVTFAGACLFSATGGGAIAAGLAGARIQIWPK